MGLVICVARGKGWLMGTGAEEAQRSSLGGRRGCNTENSSSNCDQAGGGTQRGTASSLWRVSEEVPYAVSLRRLSSTIFGKKVVTYQKPIQIQDLHSGLLL